ncbi:DUF6843 domain-containing protein [Sulfurovum lithotrophicum]|nr:hypothetical protein [Sulfurovum lithotrophicum]
MSQIDPEYGISGFFYLTITGLPLSVFGWDIHPNGGVTSLLIVGTLGLLQWVFIILFVKVLKMNKFNKIILGSTLLLFVSFFSLFIYGTSPEKGIRYLLPEKYRGWVCITYNDENFPPLKEEEGFRIIKIPPSGIVKTSSPMGSHTKEGYYIPTYDEYYYYSDNGTRKAEEIELGGGYTSRREGKKEITSYFWISTKGNAKHDYEQYIKDVPNMDDNGIIEPGCGQWTKDERK